MDKLNSGDKFYSIGEISEICDINPKTLRYYDSIELLVPQVKNENTGYRYYTENQIFDLFIIKKLKIMGFSLKEIKPLLDNDDSEMYIVEVEKKMKELDKKIRFLKKTYTEATLFIKKLGMRKERIDYFLSNKLDNQFSDKSLKQKIRDNKIQIEFIDSTDVIYTKQTMNNYNNIEISIKRWLEIYRIAEKRSLPITGSLILTYHTENPMEQFFKYSCNLEICLPVNTEGVEYEDIKTFGGFKAAVSLHIGDYSNISNTHLKLLQWIDANKLEINGPVSEEYIVSPIDLKSKYGYVTKVIIPVK